jgi:hypothetical protein
MTIQKTTQIEILKRNKRVLKLQLHFLKTGKIFTNKEKEILVPYYQNIITALDNKINKIKINNTPVNTETVIIVRP